MQPIPYFHFRRKDKNRVRAQESLGRLKDQLQLQQFLQECDELEDWLSEKNIAAQDDTYRDAKNIHSKFLRHQAFVSEIASNKERLEKLEEVRICAIIQQNQKRL